ncbi:hypothetical protein M0804_009614 [Polistes exclamans]|nr:hypothetical protein M0804_009614 [Polistes exclamans]
MADSEKQPEQPKAVQLKLVIGKNDTKEDVFVHQSAIIKNNPRKAVRSVGDGEVVEFDVVIGEKGHEAANVTGPSGEAVKGSPYAADKRRGYRGCHWIYPRRGNVRSQRRPPREGQEGYESADGKTGEEGNTNESGGQQRRYRPRRNYDYYYTPANRHSGSNQQQQGENAGEGGEQGGKGTGEGGAPRGGGRGRGGPPRRFFRRNFRGGRGGGPPRRPRNQDGQVTDDEVGAGEGGQTDGVQRIPRPRYRRRVPTSRLNNSQQTANKENLRPSAVNKIHPATSNSQTQNTITTITTKTLPEVSDKHIKKIVVYCIVGRLSEQKSDAPKDKDAPAAAPAPQESQQVQNTTTESTA